MESKLRELEARMIQLEKELAFYKSISLYSNEWTIVHSKDCKALFVSPSCEYISGYAPSEFISDQDLMMNIVLDEDKANAQTEISSEDAESAGYSRNEFRIKAKNGDVKWIERVCHKQTEADGLCGCTISVNRDITSFKEIEATLRFSDEKFRKAFHHNPCMIGLSDLETSTYVEVNQSFLDQLGFKPEEVIGKKASDLFTHYGKHRNKILQKMKDQGGYLRSEETMINDKWGRDVRVSVFAEEMNLKGKNLLLTSAFNVTEFRKVQDEVVHINGLMEILMKIATNYINLPLDKMGEGIDEALRLVGEFVDADRAYVFAYDHGKHTTSCTHEWCRNGIEPHIDSFQRVAIDTLPDYDFHKHGKIFHVPDTEMIQELSQRTFFSSIGIKGIITIPLMHNNSCFGFLGFDSIDRIKTYSQKEKVLFEFFAMALLNIHFRERNQRDLFLSNEKFRTLFEYAPLMIHVFDKNGKCLMWNRHCEEIFGWTFEELSSHQDPLSLFYIDPAELQAVKVSTTIHPVGEFIKWHPVNKQGNRLTTLWMNFMLPDGLVINIGLDVTKQNLLEKHLSVTEQKYKQLVELAHEGIWTIDENAVTTYVNPHMAEMLGFSVDEMLGRSLFTHMDKNGIEIALENIEKRKQGVTEQHEFEFIRKDGKKIFTLMKTSPMTDETGNYSGALAMVTDITNRKLAESERQKTIERYNIVSEHSRTVYWEVDKNGLYTYLSASVRIVTGYDPEELVGKFHFYDLSPVENLEQITKSAFEIFAKRRRFENFENPIQRKDSQIIWVSTSGLPFFDKDGNLQGYRGSDTDITIRKQQRDLIASNLREINHYRVMLQWLNAQLVDSEENERKKIADFLHDNLGQILAIINIKQTALLSGDKSKDDFLKTINESSLLLNHAIQECRNLTYELNPPILKEHGLLEGLRWKLSEVQKHTPINTHLVANIKNLDFDEKQRILLYRIITELINNAVKHANCSKILVKVEQHDQKLTFSVADDGKGFIYQSVGPGTSNYNFGLFSIKERLIPYSGQLLIDSAPGKGTTATVII